MIDFVGEIRSRAAQATLYFRSSRFHSSLFYRIWTGLSAFSDERNQSRKESRPWSASGTASVPGGTRKRPSEEERGVSGTRKRPSVSGGGSGGTRKRPASGSSGCSGAPRPAEGNPGAQTGSGGDEPRKRRYAVSGSVDSGTTRHGPPRS